MEDNKKIKMIWDFRGMDAQKIAEHHVHHLEEFIEREHLQNHIFGVENFSEMYSIAFMVVEESEMIMVRDALRPNRAEWYVG
ncbi:hypothetical protein [Elizabethkingia sp. JS20170427COW]|uniref:hypothetical protein n=1 Tax=Elizabethkingia sp. JS20170427COW TaxID=2583851 RepID=UPI0011102CF8|nr:hypothetical protein [Elizabethkingia sp. JS20170427COW]QCX52617.1 hypothetical protein FGE20_02060 [Elizabethkingia sp. JS20170427COW]